MIEVRPRDGQEYYYYRTADGGSLYLGSKDAPKRENVEKAYRLFAKTKAKVQRDEQIFQRLRAAIEKT